MSQEDFLGRWMDAKETLRCWLVGYQSMSSMHKLYHCPEWYEVRREIPEVSRKLEQKSRTPKKEWKWQRGTVEHLLSGSQWNMEHFSMRKWKSEKHKSWSMPAEGFKGHVATDGSLSGKTGKWGACGWAVVQLDYDEEMGPLHGSIEAEFEVQRTIKRAELTAFLCLLRKVCGPTKVHVNNKGIIDGLQKGREKVSRKELEIQTCG